MCVWRIFNIFYCFLILTENIFISLRRVFQVIVCRIFLEHWQHVAWWIIKKNHRDTIQSKKIFITIKIIQRRELNFKKKSIKYKWHVSHLPRKKIVIKLGKHFCLLNPWLKSLLNALAIQRHCPFRNWKHSSWFQEISASNWRVSLQLRFSS